MLSRHLWKLSDPSLSSNLVEPFPTFQVSMVRAEQKSCMLPELILYLLLNPVSWTNHKRGFARRAQRVLLIQASDGLVACLVGN